MKEPHALRVALGPSRAASALVCVATLSTAALVAWLPVAAMPKAVLVSAIAAYSIVLMRRWAMRVGPRAIVGIELDFDRTVCMIERSGARIEGLLQVDSYVSAWVTTIVVRPEGKRLLCSTTILPDMLPFEDFRRLRLLLRMGRVPPTITNR